MTDKEKDAVWRSLPEKVKEEIATDYSTALQAHNFDPNNARIDAHIKFLEEYFGSHNLTAEKEVKPKSEPDIHLKDEKSEFKVWLGNNPYISMAATLSADEIRKAEEEQQKAAAEHLDRLNHPEKEYTYEVTLDKVRAAEPKPEPKHGEIVIPVKAEFDDSIWLHYRMELAKEISPKVIYALSDGGVSSDFCDNVIDKVTTIVDGIVERLKGGEK